MSKERNTRMSRRIQRVAPEAVRIIRRPVTTSLTTQDQGPELRFGDGGAGFRFGDGGAGFRFGDGGVIFRFGDGGCGFPE
jgi:hypothetical protein